MFVPHERFWNNVVKTDTCWLWGGRVNKHYGKFELATGVQIGAHVWAYLNLVGPIPFGYVLDHLCLVKSCVNPTHLEPVTNAENLRRGHVIRRAARQTCRKGHPWITEELSCPICRRISYDTRNTKRAEARI